MDSPLLTLRKLFAELMGWQGEELMPVDFVMASYLTGFLPGSVEKSWGDLCGPPAIGKTEILRALEDGQRRTVMVDTLTENAFSSAMRDKDEPDKDFSLLYQLSDKREPRGPKVLVIKEMSTLLNMRREKADKIFADLRAAYDGSYTTAAGNIGLDTKTDLNFGMLTACTEKLDEFRRTNQTLGERTVVCRIGRQAREYTARQKIADHVIKGCRIRKAALRARIKIATRKAIDSAITLIKATGGKVGQGESFISMVGRLATVATSVRTVPLSKHSYANLAEGPGRLIGQLIAWGDCRVLFDGRKAWMEEDYRMVRRIAQDTMPPDNLRAILCLWRGSPTNAVKPLLGEEIRQKANLDQVFFRQLRQWTIIGILRPFEEGVYGLNPAFADDIGRTEFMEGLI
ncbi:hypothetical protein LCGC14_0549240 [marine sediment metagenome]|uniref:Uncharacterized protein n=1 Tax=marine sediment metagenome TaxID=412755 RepID=A0A0F9RQJ6_9ZZZZ